MVVLEKIKEVKVIWWSFGACGVVIGVEEEEDDGREL